MNLDTEDRHAWYAASERWEQDFVDNVAPLFGLKAKINPAKALAPWALDLTLFWQGQWTIAELKPQFTPFFTAVQRFDLPPLFTFALNVSDVEDYRADQDWWPLPLLFWMQWDKTTYRDGRRVRPLFGLWHTSIRDLLWFIDNVRPTTHAYQRRQVDARPNAKESYVFDIRHFRQINFKLTAV